ncbi:hypothetical protein MTR_8g030580 [Medicago truncatula]|uniref:Uncharacterized protein n=1 Tax=Medicago truncatula TaxID=3880 RepID=G7LBQ3_MEDTR|nr:hypothetical protein MTR_8g030580 [Medicago truncatula]
MTICLYGWLEQKSNLRSQNYSIQNIGSTFAHSNAIFFTRSVNFVWLIFTLLTSKKLKTLTDSNIERVSKTRKIKW